METIRHSTAKSSSSSSSQHRVGGGEDFGGFGPRPASAHGGLHHTVCGAGADLGWRHNRTGSARSDTRTQNHGMTAPGRMQARDLTASRKSAKSSSRPASASSRTGSQAGGLVDEGRLTPTTSVPERYFINLKETTLARYRHLGYLSDNKFKKLQKQGELPCRLAGGEARRVEWLVDMKDLTCEETAELLGLFTEGSWDAAETNRCMASRAFEELLPVAVQNGGLMLALAPPERDGFCQRPVPEVIKQLSRGLNTFQPGLIGLMLVILRRMLEAHVDVAQEILPFCRKLLPVLGIYIYSNIHIEVPPRGTLLPVDRIVSVSGYSARGAGRGHSNKKAWGLKGKSPVPLGVIPLMAKKVKLTTLIEDVLYRIIHNAYDKTAAIKLVKLSIPTYSGIAV